MVDQEIEKLIARDRHELSNLEVAIWDAEARRAAARTEVRRIVSWQAAIMLVAVLGSASFGASLATRSSEHTTKFLMASSALAPSARLFGETP